MILLQKKKRQHKLPKQNAELLKFQHFKLYFNSKCKYGFILNTKNVSGKLAIEIKSYFRKRKIKHIFGGLIGLNGSVSTKEKVPTFNMDLNLSEVNIADTFTQLDMMKKLPNCRNH
jgi:hypothetical protein